MVDPFARHIYGRSVRDSMYTPKPPGDKPDKQGPAFEISFNIGHKDMELEQKMQARRQFRYYQYLNVSILNSCCL